MTISVYKKTATVSKSGKTYAFGRKSELDGQPTIFGGYALFVMSKNYNSTARGGIDAHWSVVSQDMEYANALALMNKKCRYVAFEKSAA